MGGIANGPREMADPDFGCVSKKCFERNIPSEQAEERLIQFIKDQGKWVDAV